MIDPCRVKVSKRATVTLTKSQCDALRAVRPIGGSEDSACGTHACAYETQDPRWLVKFTDDWQDVRGLMAAGNKGLTPDVRGIYRLTGQKRGKKAVYAIEVERVEPLSKKEELLINEVLFLRLGLTAFNIADRSDPRSGAPLPFKIEPQTRADVPRTCRFIADAAKARGKPGFDDAAASASECADLIRRALDITEALGREGVFLTDNHAGNWGKKNGRLIAIDLGRSRPQWDTKRVMPPKLDGNGQWPPWRR
jgi:hypothetical protein